MAEAATSSALEVKRQSRGLTIGELAARSGVPATAIRFYESAGIIAAPPRRHGWRQYPADAAKTLRFVRLARANGVGLKQLTAMRALVESDDVSGLQRLFLVQATQADALIRDLIKRRKLLRSIASCGCESAKSCPRLTAAE